MSKINSIEQIEALFMPTAFEIIKKQHADIEDTEALFLAWKMLWSASDVYDRAIEKGKTESKAISKVFDLFYNSYKSIEA